jgi:ATP-binding cassette subfamily B multidrug efflux pump
MRAFRIWMSWVLKEPWLFGLAVVAMILCASAQIAEPWVFARAVDQAIVKKDEIALRQWVYLFLGLELLRIAMVVSQSYLFEKLGLRVLHHLRLRVFHHLSRCSIRVFDQNPVGRLVTRLTSDFSSLSEMFSSGSILIVVNLIYVIGTMIVLLTVQPRLGAIALSVLPPTLILSRVFSRRLRQAYRDARTALAQLNALFAESILGIRTLQLFGQTQARVLRIASAQEDVVRAQSESIRSYAYFQPTITLAAGISLALVISVGAPQAFPGVQTLEIGVLTAYFSYVVSLFQPLREIADRWNVLLSGGASAERIIEVLDWPLETDEGKNPWNQARGEIEFKDVWFAYDEENWVLRGLNLKISEGESLGVVGSTGAGKSTLIQLILRLYHPQRGQILFDGQPIENYSLDALRSAIGLVQQDVFLFSGSLRENISLWKTQTSPLSSRLLEELEAELGEALRLDERGGNLSLGQRQVVAYARAAAAQPLVWMLDEASSNMDSATEARVVDWLRRDSQGRTSIVVAHRLATVQRLQKIAVLHQGQVAECGTHGELMKLQGLYAKLYAYQQIEDQGSRETGSIQSV